MAKIEFAPNWNHGIDISMAAKTPRIHGYVRIPKRVLMHPELGFSDKALYMALSMHADNVTGICWPSRQILMQESGIVDKHTFKSCLVRLVAVGAVEVMRRSGYTNAYRLPDLDAAARD